MAAKLAMRVTRDDGAPPFTVTGQTAKAIRALVLARRKRWRAYRFAAYCHCLRKHGLDIETLREAHNGGWHGRHVLHTLVHLEPAHC